MTERKPPRRTAPQPDANAVRPMDIKLGDDMPVDVRVRLDCARIAVKAAGHIGLEGVRALAAEIEDYVLKGGATRQARD